MAASRWVHLDLDTYKLDFEKAFDTPHMNSLKSVCCTVSSMLTGLETIGSQTFGNMSPKLTDNE